MAAPNPQARLQVPADFPVSDIKACSLKGLAAIRALITVSSCGTVPTQQVSGSPRPSRAPSPLHGHGGTQRVPLSAPRHPRLLLELPSFLSQRKWVWYELCWESGANSNVVTPGIVMLDRSVWKATIITYCQGDNE